MSSGHGTQTEDLDGDEGDDDDEAICPVDYHDNGLIVDDDSESHCFVFVCCADGSVSTLHERRQVITYAWTATICSSNPFLLDVG
jgi:ferredoxin-thioredoxin reductase catalytic subunit